MLVACWSAKGGAGTTVVAAALAALLARSAPGGAVLADLGGDTPALVGLAEPIGLGLADWLAAGSGVGAPALAEVEVPLCDGLTLLPRGCGALGPPARAEVLAAVLADDPRPIVVDCGVLGAGADKPCPVCDGDLALRVASCASLSLLVLRPCYLAVRRAVAVPVRPSGLVLVREPGRSLTADDIEQVLGAPVRAEIDIEPAVARAVDAGTFLHRLPSSLVRALHAAA